VTAPIWILVSSGLLTALTITSSGALAQDSKSFTGLASVYSKDYSGPTADGEDYDPHKFTCAHPTLPFGTRLRVSHGGRSVTVVVNDRGPFVNGRVLELSRAAGKALHILDAGVVVVTAKVQ
jgi:rare lipoprotein A